MKDFSLPNTAIRHIFLVVFVITLFGIASCNRHKQEQQAKQFPQRDMTIDSTTAFNKRFLDSAQVESFVKARQLDSATANNLRAFYNSRNYQFAWFDDKSLNEQGLTFWNLVSNYIHISKDSSLFNRSLNATMSEILDDSLSKISPQLLAQTDLALTRQFFVYAQTAYAGKLEPADLQWFIPRKKIDALALLDSLIARKGDNIEMWEPVNPMYQALRKKLVQYDSISDRGGWDSIRMDPKKKYSPGDSSPVIKQVKARLAITDIFHVSDTSYRYDSSLVGAVKESQRSFGLRDNGVIDMELVSKLNVPIKVRIEQMLINLERMRWLPEKSDSNRIVVNIPEFVLHVFENNKQVIQMKIVVGKEGTSTVIFNDNLKYIVFSPYWNVPRSIVRNEVAPALKRNKNYLSRNHMEITGNSGGLPIVRQLPGPWNSLGRVKFLFPNNFNIYFHDTPAKSLFSRDNRAFSHGCIRLSEPEELANYLLRDNPEWTPQKIKEAMMLGKEKWVTLKTPVPVYISYYTSWVGPNGLLNFREDIYDHDKEMAEHLFTNSQLSKDEEKAKK